MSNAHIPNHRERLLALLPSAFRTPGVEAFAGAFAAPVQAVADFCVAAYSGLNVDTATEPGLGLLGALVGEAQGTLSNDEYRRIIKAKARALRSGGTAADIVAVANLALAPGGGASIVELPPCYYEVRLPADPGAPLSAEMRSRVRRVLDLARPAGWGAQYVYFEGSPFAFDGPPQPGYDVGGYADYL